MKYKFKLKDLTVFVPRYLANQRQIAKATGLSWPAVGKYLYGKPSFPEEPSLPHIAALLKGLGVPWQDVTLGELLDEQGSYD